MSECIKVGEVAMLVIAVWALMFGVTIGDKHYRLDRCSTERGVMLHEAEER